MKLIIHTKTSESQESVKRDHNDFVLLYNHFVETKEYHGWIVPPVPPPFNYTVDEKSNKEVFETRVKEIIVKHELFLLRLVNHHIYSHDNYLRNFLLKSEFCGINNNVKEINAKFLKEENVCDETSMINCHRAITELFNDASCGSLTIPRHAINELEFKRHFQTINNSDETFPWLVYIVAASSNQNRDRTKFHTSSFNKCLTENTDEELWHVTKQTEVVGCTTPKSTFRMCEENTNVYMHQLPQWPYFYWIPTAIQDLLTSVNSKQQQLFQQMENLGFDFRSKTKLDTLTLDVVKSSAIEGEALNPCQVRSSIARRLKIENVKIVKTNEDVEGVVSMHLDAMEKNEELTVARLFRWHSELFPNGRNLVVGRWRDNKRDDPMQVVSGRLGMETVHFRAPDSNILKEEMDSFLHWFNTSNNLDPVIKAAVAHLWFVTIHPFDDGNGRITRALTDMLLARGDQSLKQFCSMSNQILKERNSYYTVLERSQCDLNITEWLKWFLNCLLSSFKAVEDVMVSASKKAAFWKRESLQEFSCRQTQGLNKLLDDFYGKLNVVKWSRMMKCSRDEAEKDLKDLVSKQILKQDNNNYVFRNE